jgi:hypothetical protein
LPDPAPATTNSGPPGAVTASSCGGLSSRASAATENGPASTSTTTAGARAGPDDCVVGTVPGEPDDPTAVTPAARPGADDSDRTAGAAGAVGDGGDPVWSPPAAFPLRVLAPRIFPARIWPVGIGPVGALPAGSAKSPSCAVFLLGSRTGAVIRPGRRLDRLPLPPRFSASPAGRRSARSLRSPTRCRECADHKPACCRRPDRPR